MSVNTVAPFAPTAAPRPLKLWGAAWLIPALALTFVASYGLYAVFGSPHDRLTAQESIAAPTEDWHGNVRVMSNGR